VKFYIASSLENAPSVQKLGARLLQQPGFTWTYDWTVHGSVMNESALRKAEVARAELDGATRANLLIVLLPGGKGTHVELGAALASNRRPTM